MSRITSKLQITVPKAIAVLFGLKPGDEVEWSAEGSVIRLIPGSKPAAAGAPAELRLRIFDEATRRQKKRERSFDPAALRPPRKGRGWSREDLYGRARSR